MALRESCQTRLSQRGSLGVDNLTELLELLLLERWELIFDELFESFEKGLDLSLFVLGSEILLVLLVAVVDLLDEGLKSLPLGRNWSLAFGSINYLLLKFGSGSLGSKVDSSNRLGDLLCQGLGERRPALAKGEL